MFFALRHCGRSSAMLRSSSSSSFSFSSQLLPRSTPLLHKHIATTASDILAGARGTQRLSSLASLSQLTLLDARLQQAQDPPSDAPTHQNPRAVQLDSANNTAVFGTESRITDLLNALQGEGDADKQMPLVAQATDGRAVLSYNTRLRDLVRDTTAGDDAVVFRLSSFSDVEGSEQEQKGSSILVMRPRVATVLSTLLSPERVQQQRDDLYAKENALAATIQTLESTKAVLDARVERSLFFRGTGVGLVLIGQWLVLAWGTWSELSWDVMEPVTYFLGLFVTIVGASHFAIFKTTDSYNNLWGRWRMKKREKLYKASDFDPIALDQMRLQLAEIQNKIASRVSRSQ